jgi:hypothetical protein
MRPLVLLAICVASFSIGAPGSAGAAALGFTGTLQLQVGPTAPLTIPGAGSAQVADDGSFHLLSLVLPATAFGPVTVSVPPPYPYSTPWTDTVNSVIFTELGNLTGSFTGISGGPPGGGPMGLSGTAKICLVFSYKGTCNSYVPLPLAATPGGAGFGIGGTRSTPIPYPDPTWDPHDSVTMQNAPWTIGQPTMEIHTPGSTISAPVLPGGFAHGPASLASNTARLSGALQLVTISKVFTNLGPVGEPAFPEFPVFGILTLHFVPEPGTALLLGSGLAGLGVIGRRRRRR